MLNKKAHKLLIHFKIITTPIFTNFCSTTFLLVKYRITKTFMFLKFLCQNQTLLVSIHLYINFPFLVFIYYIIVNKKSVLIITKKSVPII